VDRLGFAFAFSRDAAYPVPVADEKSWKNTWHWKDELAEAKRLYYGKILVSKPTFVSMKMLPVFFATHGRAGEPDDHLEDVRSGRVSDIGRRVIEFVTQKGESQTRRMRAELGITSKEGRGQYDKALDEVQRLMYVARVKAVGEGREEYNYTYDLFVRRYREVVKAAEPIASADARARILAAAVGLAGALTERQAGKLFDWGDGPLRRAADRLAAQGALARLERGREAILVLPQYADAP